MLTFEHVPPEKAYNHYPALLQTFEQYEAGAGEATVLSRGRGGHHLCSRCNSVTGGDFGGAFVEWARQGMEQIHHTYGKTSINYHGVIHPLRVIKQVAVLFFDTCGPDFQAKNPDLVRFVMDRERTGLPPSYHFHVFWFGGGNLRQSGIVGTANLDTGHATVISEFVHPPFGYVLTFENGLWMPGPEEITYFAQYEYGEAITLNKRFRVLETNWMMPGDYRTVQQIARDAHINDLTAAGYQEPEAEFDRRTKDGLVDDDPNSIIS